MYFCLRSSVLPLVSIVEGMSMRAMQGWGRANRSRISVLGEKHLYAGVQGMHGWGFRVWLLAFSTGLWEWYVLAKPSSHVPPLFYLLLSSSSHADFMILIWTRHLWTLAIRCSAAMTENTHRVLNVADAQGCTDHLLVAQLYQNFFLKAQMSP